MHLLLAFFGLAIIVGVILSRTIAKDSRYNLKPLPSIILILLGLGLCMTATIVNIKPDYVGIVKENGVVDNEVLNSGINFVNPIADVVQLDTRIQNDTIYSTDAKETNDTLVYNTLDGGTVKMGLVVACLVDPAKAIYLYNEAGTDFNEKIVQPLSHNILRHNTMAYTAQVLKTSSWDDFSSRVTDDLKTDLRKHGLVVAKIVIRKLEADEPAPTPAIAEKETVKKTIATVPHASKPIAKKPLTSLHKNTVQPIAKVHKKKNTALPVSAPVAKTRIVKKITHTVVTHKVIMHKTTHTSVYKDNLARVDTTYDHKLQKQIADNSTGLIDTSYHSNLAEKSGQQINDALANTVSQTDVHDIPASAPPIASLFVAENATPMDAVSFSSMKDFVDMHIGDDKKLEVLNGIAKINSFSTAQVLTLSGSLVSPDAKLEFAKLAYPRTVDRFNYGAIAESLNRRSKRKLDKYIVHLMAGRDINGVEITAASPTSPGNNLIQKTDTRISQNVVPEDCHLIDEERYTTLRKRIVADNTQNVKQDFIKSTVEHNCFTSEQVLKIVKLLKTPKAKLDFAKMAYPRTTDRANYSMVAGSLKSKSRRELDKYIVRLMATAIAEKPKLAPTANDEREIIAKECKDHKSLDETLLVSIKDFVESHPGDHAKLEALSKIMSDNYFTSSQIAELIGLFESENAKLEFAKNAYSRTIDKGTYNLVMNSLNSSSQKILEDYIVGLFASR